jgi:predicted PurR-regulated permease PerM
MTAPRRVLPIGLDDEAPAPATTPDTTPPDVVTARFTVSQRTVAIVIATILVVAALRLARPVVMPVVLGVFLATVARPLQVRVASVLPRRLRWLGLVVAMLVLIGLIGAFVTALVTAGNSVLGEFRDRRPQIERQLVVVRERVRRTGLPVPGALEGVGAPTGTVVGATAAMAPASVPGGPRGALAPPARRAATAEPSGGGVGETGAKAATQVVSALGSTVTLLLLSLAFAALAMSEMRAIRTRIAHLARGTAGWRTFDILDEVAPAFRRYVLVKTVTSCITGTSTFLLSLALGIPLAWIWGLLAFLLEYIPSVGSLLAIAPPVLMALVDGGPERALLALGVIGTMQVILGNVVDPRIEGSMMQVSPFVVLTAIVFWGWLWGAPGALIAVPLTVAVVICCRHLPGAQGVATLLAGDGVEARDEEP